MSSPMLPIAVFLSGSGRTLANLIHYREQKQLPIDIRLVIGSRDQLRGIEIADADGIPTKVIKKRDYSDPDRYSDAMFQSCRDVSAEVVVMAGFLKHVLIPSDFENKVINIHPSLLPAFGGEGMYGQRVHQAAIDRGVTITGCTIHYVDNQYDNGPIILQRTCPVLSGDTSETLAARVFEQECFAFPEALKKIAGQRLK